MKLIFKYVCHEGWVPKSYIRVCKSFRRVNEISGEINQKDFWDLVLKKNILNEIYLAEYLYDTDLNLAEYVLDKLNDKTIDDYDIGSQGWDVELEEDNLSTDLYYDYDYHFHKTFFDYSNNKLLKDLFKKYNLINEILVKAYHKGAISLKNRKACLEDHENIIKSIEENNISLTLDLTKKHYLSAEKIFKKLIKIN